MERPGEIPAQALLPYSDLSKILMKLLHSFVVWREITASFVTKHPNWFAIV
jgi:hypothetical protein